jgi:hypothetical protein
MIAENCQETAKAQSPLIAVRRHCVCCWSDSAHEVAPCPAQRCPLWMMRAGRRPDAMPAQARYPAERPMPDNLTTLAAIKRRCMDCAGGSAIWAKGCTSHDCDLWPFRMGKNPNRAGIGNPGHFAGKTPTQGPVGRDGAGIGARVPDAAGRASAAA